MKIRQKAKTPHPVIPITQIAFTPRIMALDTKMRGRNNPWSIIHFVYTLTRVLLMLLYHTTILVSPPVRSYGVKHRFSTGIVLYHCTRVLGTVVSGKKPYLCTATTSQPERLTNFTIKKNMKKEQT